VFLRWLNFILKERGPFTINNDDLEGISRDLLDMKQWCPVEFKRKPRELKRAGNHLRGKELRRILLYDGLKAFRRNMPENLFKNYLLLHCAMYILTSPHLYQLYNTVANDLLREFVLHAKRIFGRHFVVYNVHSLIHISSECLMKHRALDELSTFKYERYLKDIRSTLQSGYRPLQQLADRFQETGGHLIKPKEIRDPDVAVLSRPHQMDEEIDGAQFQEMKYKKLTLALK